MRILKEAHYQVKGYFHSRTLQLGEKKTIKTMVVLLYECKTWKTSKVDDRALKASSNILAENPQNPFPSPVSLVT